MGAAVGFLGLYAQQYIPISHPQSFNLGWQAIDTASVLVLYPVTLFVFYGLGKTKVPRLRTGVLTLLTLVSGLVGETAGHAALLLVPKYYVLFPIVFGFPYFITENLITGFTFLFVALSGVALARLRSGGSPLPNVSRKTSIALALIAFGFFFVPNFWYGYFVFRLPSIFFLTYADLALMFLTLLRFLIFYYAGRKVSIVGRQFRYFGLLFVGAYVGAILGTAIAVALFGQSQWSMQPYAIGSTSGEYGIIFRNIPQSPLMILESLIPVQSLPFLAFFAMSVSHLGSTESPKFTPSPAKTDQDEHLEYVNPSAAS